MLRLQLALMLAGACLAQQPAAPPTGEREYDDRQEQVLRSSERMVWYARLGDIADVDEVDYASLPPVHIGMPTVPGAGNPLVIHAWTFIPKQLDRTKPQPLLVFPHGGVHSRVTVNYVHIIREMVAQGYSVIAPDYRGSTGYGKTFYEAIDYGGRENDDIFAARNWMLETYSFLDAKRVGLVGWSHGGMITLMNLFEHPESYRVAYAGVPVSDLVTRLGYKGAGYARDFAAPYHIGRTVADDPDEYLRRSPVTHVAKLATPLLIHTNTNDEDVAVLEVRRLLTALQAAGKKFEYKIYDAAPGGHVFNRIDTKLARESRREIWRFLAGYLQPERPMK